MKIVDSDGDQIGDACPIFEYSNYTEIIAPCNQPVPSPLTLNNSIDSCGTRYEISSSFLFSYWCKHVSQKSIYSHARKLHL